ncbi:MULTISPECIES: hypothetical protein [Leclercia]|uniref:hypothetical protein n=1 Tax=Leclercia TaxID=83654 RepID=UPI0012E2CDA2|nr:MULTISPECIES: hypothetical protein [Leclercia]QGU15010.1 hypothetical protein GNG27_10180 [Leclercia sp. 119287]
MKRLLIAAAMLATFGVHAQTALLTTVYTCGNHVITDVGMKVSGARYWLVNYEIKTNGVEVYNGDGEDIPYHSIENNTVAFYEFPGFIWESNNNNDTTAYSNDGGANYYPCHEHSNIKRFNS